MDYKVWYYWKSRNRKRWWWMSRSKMNHGPKRTILTHKHTLNECLKFLFFWKFHAWCYLNNIWNLFGPVNTFRASESACQNSISIWKIDSNVSVNWWHLQTITGEFGKHCDAIFRFWLIWLHAFLKKISIWIFVNFENYIQISTHIIIPNHTFSQKRHSHDNFEKCSWQNGLDFLIFENLISSARNSKFENTLNSNCEST